MAAAGLHGWVVLAAPIVGCYAVALLHGGRWGAAVATVNVAAGITTIVVRFEEAEAFEVVAAGSALGVVGVVVGLAVRYHRAYAAMMRGRVAEAERARDEEARRRVAQERLRIARDLHDIVADRMTTINVQAATAAYVVDRQPEAPAAMEALVAIKQADMSAVRVLLADDQGLVRAGFRRLLDAADDVVAVGEAATGAEAIRLAAETRPEVVLMDIRMPEMDGIEATRRIVADDRLAGTRVLILTTFDHDDHILDALRAGASGFMVKDAEPEELLRAIRVVAQGDALLSPGVTRRVIARLAAGARAPLARTQATQRLTKREQEVVVLAAEGMSNDEIAEALFISHNTAKTHVSRAMVKLGARDRAQLVAMAYQTGLATAPPP